ncbi:hypothetical protein BDQ17DRAFT_1411683 [Cyathus striatus]|nr:hypothetical protein BDQ17DRAFT_1411683 [Cyathus striatus]
MKIETKAGTNQSIIAPKLASSLKTMLKHLEDNDKERRENILLGVDGECLGVRIMKKPAETSVAWFSSHAWDENHGGREVVGKRDRVPRPRVPEERGYQERGVRKYITWNMVHDMSWDGLIGLSVGRDRLWLAGELRCYQDAEQLTHMSRSNPRSTFTAATFLIRITASHYIRLQRCSLHIVLLVTFTLHISINSQQEWLEFVVRCSYLMLVAALSFSASLLCLGCFLVEAFTNIAKL